MRGKLILETEGKINLLVTLIQCFLTQNKQSLILTKTLFFPHKAAYFLNDWHESYKNAYGNSKFHMSKLANFFLKIDFLKTIN